MNQTIFSQKDVTVLVSNHTVAINSISSLQLSFSPTNELAMSVSAEVADVVCGACGSLRQTEPTLRSLRDTLLLLLLHGPTTAFKALNVGQWEAPDFPRW